MKQEIPLFKSTDKNDDNEMDQKMSKGLHSMGQFQSSIRGK